MNLAVLLSALVALLAVLGVEVDAAQLKHKKHVLQARKAHKDDKAAKEEADKDDADDDADDDDDDEDEPVAKNDAMVNSKTAPKPIEVTPTPLGAATAVAEATAEPAPVVPKPLPPVPPPTLAGAFHPKPMVMAPPAPPAYPFIDHTPKPWDELEGHLNEVQTRQSQLKSELKVWANHAQWDSKIEADQKALAKETTGALADMLADIRTELHQLAVPVYTDVLYENLEALNEKEHFLKDEITSMKQKEAKYAAEQQGAAAPPTAAAPEKDEVEEMTGVKRGTLFMDFIFMLIGGGIVAIAFVVVRGAYGA